MNSYIIFYSISKERLKPHSGSMSDIAYSGDWGAVANREIKNILENNDRFFILSSVEK